MKMETEKLQLNVLTNEDLNELKSSIVDELLSRLQPKEQSNDELLTINEVCRLLKKTRCTVWRMEKSGAIKPIIIGGSKMYRRSDFI
jgi:predicted DNA-binding transcriptional regulator AlpA